MPKYAVFVDIMAGRDDWPANGAVTPFNTLKQAVRYALLCSLKFEMFPNWNSQNPKLKNKLERNSLTQDTMLELLAEFQERELEPMDYLHVFPIVTGKHLELE